MEAGPFRKRFEMVDEATAAMYRAMTPQRRLEIAFGMFSFARDVVRDAVRREHPEWSQEQVNWEVLRRLTGASR